MPRRALYEAGKTVARASAPGHRCYATIKDRKNSMRAALSGARKILRQAHHILAGPGDDALAPATWHTRHGDQRVTAAAPRSAAAELTDGDHRGRPPPIRCQPRSARPARRTA